MAYSNPFAQASGRGTGNPFFPDEEATQSDLPLWRRNELLDQLGERTKPTTSKLLDWINFPMSVGFDVLAGNELGSGTKSKDVLETYGLYPEKDALGGWGRPIAEFGLEAVADPTNLLTFGGGAVSKAAMAAKAAGLADDAVRVAGRNLIDDVATGARQLDNLGDMGYARNAAQSLADNFAKPITQATDDDLLSRPLVGGRAARRNTTLRELVESQADPNAARSSVEDWLRKNGDTFDNVADDALYNDMGLALPKFMGGPLTWNMPGGAQTAAAFDRAGQALRWSRPGRYAVSLTNLFGDRVAGQVDEMGQILAKSDYRGRVRADQRSGRWRTVMMRELAERSPGVFEDTQVSNAVRNTIEGTGTAADQALVQQHNLGDFVNKWRAKSSEILDRSRTMGLGAAELADPYDTQYFPRGVDEGVFARGNAIKDSGKDWSVNTPDQIARDEAYKVPGGTRAINDLSRDAGVLNAPTDGDAAEYIYRTLNARRHAHQPEYTRAHAVKLARDIRSMTPEARAAGRGLFDSHFTEDAARYVQGRERAMERARVMYDALGSSARIQNYLDVPGGGHDSINRTLHNLGLKTHSLPTLGPVPPTPMYGPLARGQSWAAQYGPNVQQFLADTPEAIGAKHQLLERINARLSQAGQPLLTLDDLAGVSIDQRIVERFQRIADYYAVPEAQNNITQFLDDLTSMWKSSVLSWPARFARDWFSGAISNAIEVGSIPDLRNGYKATKHLLQGQFDELAPIVAKMPKYEALAAQDINAAVAAYRDDLGASGLLTGRRIDDLGTTLTGRQTGQSLRDSVLPGASPVTTVGYQATDLLSGRAPLGADRAAYSELYNRGVQGYTDSISRFGRAINPFDDTVRFADYIGDKTVTDPVLRWSAKLGDTTDSINRLAGYNGLLLQGVSPEEATRRMMQAQVDYNSLTKFERGFIRRIIPFWSYNSRIGAYIAEKIWERPGGPYTQIALRAPDKVAEAAGSDQESYTPKQIKENVGFSLEPFRQLPIVGGLVDTIAPPKDGVNSYMNSIEIPGTGLINMLQVKQSLDGSIQPGNSIYNTFLDTTSNLMHPLIKDGVELLSGRNLHTGKTLNEFQPTIQKIGRELGVDPGTATDAALKMSNYLLDFVPHAPRVLQLTNRLMDTERVPDLQARLLQNAINMGSGVKVTNIGEDAARMDASRELMDMMSDSPAIRQFENKFIPEELLPYASPDDLMIYRLDRQMKKEARAARKRSDPSGSNPFGI